MRRAFFLAVLVIAACTPRTEQAATSDTVAAPDPAADRAAIERVRSDWIAAAERDDAAAVANLYVDDAVMVGSDTPLARGREAIREGLTQGFATASGLEVNSEDLTVSDDVAYDYGTYTQTIRMPDGQTRSGGGHYLVVLKRQADGSWKIVRHLSTTPPTEAEAAGDTR